MCRTPWFSVLWMIPFLLLATIPVHGQRQPIAAAVEIEFDFDSWPWPLHQEVADRLHEMAKLYPNLASVYSIGKSVEKRDLWLIEITNKETGPGESKPAMWMDGNIHAAEVWGRRGLMYAVEKWLANYGKDSHITDLLDTRTLYVLPIFDVDHSERVLTRHPAWKGHKPESPRGRQQRFGRDLDGDGYITQMRIKDPEGGFYPSRIDPRVMLQIRDASGSGRTSAFVPATLDEEFEPLASPEERYRVMTEGAELEREVTVEREPVNFNRNFSAEWEPIEVGAGPYPFSQPEVRAVADFMTSHKNIFFQYTIHGGGGARNYQVRVPMNQPFESMPAEDNDFYTRVGAIWSLVSNGGVLNSNYYGQEIQTGRYGYVGEERNGRMVYSMKGFANDWAYLHLGVHSLLPEVHDPGKDYDNDGYVTTYEIMRWNDEEHGGKYFDPWTPYNHPVLGDIEIGGFKGLPAAIGERFKNECETHFRLLTYITGLSPLLRIKELTAEPQSDGTYRVVATLQNQGFLATYVTRHSLNINRDFSIVASIAISGGEATGPTKKKVGHILGKLSYIRRWGGGADESTRQVEWIVKPDGGGPVEVTVEAWAYRAGRDEKSVALR